ncbi:MAG: hypothetical protein AB7I42_21365 [Bradyrhizobium sp.]|uniref:hypothetical protein n=1 Tax=Bradyrhizobium sp. TaxID=376 RepID=UPI003D147D75
MIPDGLSLARAVHVLSLVHWIGGVAAVTTIVLPLARRLGDAAAAVEFFESFERRFVRQVRISIALAGLSGLYMLHALDAWDRFRHLTFWWLHLMVAVWCVFALMVFVIEPLFAHRKFREFAMQDAPRAFTLAVRLHVVALTVSALAIGAGVLGSYGALP